MPKEIARHSIKITASALALVSDLSEKRRQTKSAVMEEAILLMAGQPSNAVPLAVAASDRKRGHRAR